MKPPAHRQIHHRFGGRVQQLQHQHRRDGEHQHRQAIDRQLQPQPQGEDHHPGEDMDTEIALAGEGIDQPLGRIAKAGRQITGDLPSSNPQAPGAAVDRETDGGGVTGIEL